MLKENWLQGSSADESLLDYVSCFRTRLHKASELAWEKLHTVQGKMKKHYD